MTKLALVVDDSPTIRNMIKATIEPEGWETIVAQDGEKAIKALKNKDVDLIITDVNMPNMGGVELIERVRQNSRTKNVPIIVITTEGNDKTRGDIKAAGASGWIVKPFDPQALLNAIAKTCSA